MAKQPTLFIDLDNTLVECSRYYIEAKQTAVDFLAKHFAMAARPIAAIVDALDLAAIEAGMGFQRDRFPRAFATTAIALWALRKRTMSFDRAEQLGETAASLAAQVFDAPYDLYPGVIHALIELRADYQLVLVTKGETAMQQLKITKHQLDMLVDHVFIVEHKTPSVLRDIVAAVDAELAASYVIGDSVRDDIATGHAVGLGTILVSGNTITWGYESTTPTVIASARVNQFCDVLDLLPLLREGSAVPPRHPESSTPGTAVAEA